MSLLSGLLACGWCGGRYGLILRDRFGCLNHHRRGICATNRTIRREEIERAVAGILAAIEDGIYQPVMKARMEAWERRKAEIAERLAQAPADLPDVHPNVANIYRAKVATFTEVLDDPDGGAAATEAIRSLIVDVVLWPGPKRRQVAAELRGELMGILDFAESCQDQRIGRVWTSAVAGPEASLPAMGQAFGVPQAADLNRLKFWRG